MPIDLSTARKYADGVITQLAPNCAQIEIAGSIRRKRSEVGDIDLVLEPKRGQRWRIRDKVMSWRPQVLEDGQVNLLVVVKDIQLDIFFADEPGADLFSEPSNWGSLLICRTGSKEFNIALAARAKDHGLHWNPYRGIIDHGRVIACATEESVFSAVGLSWIPPEQREA